MRNDTDEGFQARMERKAAAQRYFARPVTDGPVVTEAPRVKKTAAPRDRSAAARKFGDVCKGPCGKKLRVANAKAGDHPGTVAHFGLGFCKTCHKKREVA